MGKASLFSLVAGARALQSGRLEVLDGDMAEAEHRRARCSRIAYMPQGLGRNLYPTLSVFENADFFARLFGHGRQERERRIGQLLSATGLTPFACLLYTSDAADDLLCVDLGGRRIINKKTQKYICTKRP